MPMYTPSQADLERVANDFSYHPCTGPDQAEAHQSVRDECRKLALHLLRRCPPSRERSLALTKLEEAMMHANAAISRNEPPA